MIPKKNKWIPDHTASITHRYMDNEWPVRQQVSDAFLSAHNSTYSGLCLNKGSPRLTKWSCIAFPFLTFSSFSGTVLFYSCPQGEEIFLDMFEDEYRSMTVSPFCEGVTVFFVCHVLKPATRRCVFLLSTSELMQITSLIPAYWHINTVFLRSGCLG